MDRDAPQRPVSEDNDPPLRHSEPVEALLSAPPPWLLRSGTTMVGAAFFLILLASWIIHYPEVVDAPITVTTEDPPLSVVSEVAGEMSLEVADGDTVVLGQILAYIRSPTRPSDAGALRTTLDSLRTRLGSADSLLPQRLPPVQSLRLGDLEETYAELVTRYQDYLAFHTLGYEAGAIENLSAQLRLNEERGRSLQNQIRLMTREVELSRAQHRRSQELLAIGAHTPAEYEAVEQGLLSAERALENLKSSAIGNRLELVQLSRSLLDLERQRSNGERSVRLNLDAAIEATQSRLAAWEKRYVLSAPRDGSVSLFDFWSDGQWVPAGAEVLTVVPVGDPGRLMGRISLPRKGAGRVQVGQRVRVKLDRYPFVEYGAVPGVVNEISLIARDDHYLVDVAFPRGLTTSFGADLELRHEMAGQAEIVTKDLRLMERIFNRLRAAVQRS